MKAADIRQRFSRKVTFFPELVPIAGSINAALMLSRIIYWSDKTSDEGGWFFKTQEEWHAETGMTRAEQEGARAKLLDRRLIEETRMGLRGKLHYRADLEVVGAALQNAEIPVCGNSSLWKSRTSECGNSALENAEKSQSLPTAITTALTTCTEKRETENEAPPAPAKVEQCGSFQVQVFEPVAPAPAAPTPPQRQPVPLEASNRRCEPDPREERPKAVTLGKACDDAIFLYCDKAGYLKWIDRLKVYAAKFRDERGIPEAVLIGLLPQAAERGRKLWSEHDHGQHGPRPIFLNRLEEGLADAVNLWQQEQRAEANRREAAEKARNREAAPPVDHAEEFRRHMDALVEAGPGSPEWEAITSKTERDIVRQRYRQRHPDQWVAYLERQAAQMQAQRAGAHS